MLFSLSDRAALAAIFASAFVAPSDARSQQVSQEVSQEVSVATVGLRAGFDSNPLNVQGGASSAFITQSATWDYLRGSDKDGYAISLVTSNTAYQSPTVAPAIANLLRFQHAASLGEGVLLRSSFTTGQEASWSRRIASALWRERIDREAGAWRMFGSMDARYTSLNERNVFAGGDFLPYAENFVTLSAMPGAAYRFGEGEVGASVSAARSFYGFDTDYLGLARDNDRYQANVFAFGAIAGVRLEGSASVVHAAFRSDAFADVTRLLYTAKAAIPLTPLGLPEGTSLELASARTLEDTTLPFAVYNLSTVSDAKLVTRWNPRTTLSFFARHKIDDYLGLGARSVMWSGGAEYEYAFEGGWSLQAGASIRRIAETGNPPVIAQTIHLGLRKRIDMGSLNARTKAPPPGHAKPQPR